MNIAALLVISYALALTLAPSVRIHGTSEPFQIEHWLGVVVWVAAFSLINLQTKRRLPNRDPYILPIAAVLSGIGLMTIWRLYPGLGLRQTIWTAIAFMIVLLGFQFPHFLDNLRRYKYIWLVLGLILTGLTIFLGRNPNGSGPTLWLQIFGIYIQPSEPLKLLVIGYLAGYFADRFIMQRKSLQAALPLVIIMGMALLLLFLQRDLGTAIIFFLVFLAMLFSARDYKWLMWLTPVMIFAAAVAGYLTIDVVRLRINTWLNPFSDPSGSSYQVIQSMIAIAEGGIIGTGPGLGSPGLVPVSVSDFIFSAISEELGFLSAAFIILLFILLIYRGIKAASTAQTSFKKYLVLGIVYYFGIQSILIIGGNIGLLPLTGVTLPFVSYGGSSLLVSFVALMILLVVSDNAPKPTSPAVAGHKRISVIGMVLIGILILEITATSCLSFWFKSALVERAENPRWVIDDRYVLRGGILDRDDWTIAYSTGEPGAYYRASDYTPLSTIIGYTNGVYGQTGIEASMFSYLRGYEGHSQAAQFWNDLIYNQPLEGLDIRLTIDMDLQTTADSLLAESPGSIVLMNAESGEILVMASHPFFDPETLEEDWEDLINDEAAPLLNRTTQGLYPAGASLAPFILTVESDLTRQDPQESLSGLTGSLDCALAPGDELTWGSLVAGGCTDVQEALGERAGTAALLELYEGLGFYSEPELNLTVAEVAAAEITDTTAFYRGEESLSISPLQMAMAASALTHEGVLPVPRIVNSYQDPGGEWIALPKAGSSTQALSGEKAVEVTELLQDPDCPYWSVTANAQTEDGETITWFLAGTTADWQGQPLSLVIVLEADDPETAKNIGRHLIEQAIQYGN